MKSKLNLRKYKLELRHITVLAMILILFQAILTIVQRSSFQELLNETQIWYQRNSAERLANVNSTALELLIENFSANKDITPVEEYNVIRSFNIILIQQMLEQNIEDIVVLAFHGGNVVALDNGEQLHRYLVKEPLLVLSDSLHSSAINLFKENAKIIKDEERIISFLKDNSIFQVLVPLAPNGELIGAFYMENKPDFSSITSELLTSYNQIAIFYVSLILLGVLTMYYVSSYTMKERDTAQQKLFDEHQLNLKTKIEHDKEALFTKRIYHTHHKAEKVMGFIKDDLNNISAHNLDKMKVKVTKYANFVARVIYDMKWYDPPLQTIRNQTFNTDINDTIKFIVENIFLRVSSKIENIKFKMNFADYIPAVHINEFVVWEIIEPLIQNSIDHAPARYTTVSINTIYSEELKEIKIIIEDDGNGISEELLEKDDTGIQKLFLENVTTKNTTERNSGYGCYIVHQIATKRCGWQIRAENHTNGCRFIITIKA